MNKKFSFILLLTTLLILSSFATAETIEWVEVLSDEFNDASLNTTLWQTHSADACTTFTESGGYLNMASSLSCAHTGGSIKTKTTAITFDSSKTYKIVARMKASTGYATLPAPGIGFTETNTYVDTYYGTPTYYNIFALAYATTPTPDTKLSMTGVKTVGDTATLYSSDSFSWDETWHTQTLIYDYTTGEMTGNYDDGTNNITLTHTSTNKNIPTYAFFQTYGYSSVGPYNTVWDYIKIYEKVIIPEYYEANENYGLVASYTFDEGSLSDYVGTYDLTNNGADCTATGALNEGCDFSSNYINSNTYDWGISSTSDMTYSFWVDSDSFSLTQSIIDSYVQTMSGKRGQQILINSDGKVYAGGGDFLSGSNYVFSLSTETLLINTLYHIVVVFKGDSSAVKIYIDGIEGQTESSRVGSPNTNFISSHVNTQIGRDNGATDYLDGTLDELKIWNKALNQSEINTLHESGTPTVLSQYPINNSNNLIARLQASYEPTNTETANYTFIGNPSGHANGLSFDGVGDALDLHQVSLTGNTINISMTVETTETQAGLIDWRDSGNDGFGFFIIGGYLHFRANANIYTYTETPINDGAEHKINAYFDGRYSYVYVDGNLQDTPYDHGSQTMSLTSTPIFGTLFDLAPTYEYTGTVKDLIIIDDSGVIFNSTLKSLTDQHGTNQLTANGDVIHSTTNGWEFDGVGDYLTGDDVSCEYTNDFSVVMRAKATNNGVLKVLADCRADGNVAQKSGWYIAIKDDEYMRAFKATSSSVDQYADDTTNEYVSDGNEHLIIATYSSITGMKIYVDGNLAVTNTDTSNIYYGADTGLSVGTYDNDGVLSFYHEGNIQDFKIYDRALTQSDVTYLHSGTYNTYDFNTQLGVVMTNGTHYLEEIVELKSTTPVGITGTEYATIYSADYTATNTGEMYINSLIESSVNLARTQNCKVTVNGTDYDTETSRSMSAEIVGNTYLHSSHINITENETYQIDVQCQKVENGGTLIIGDTNTLLNIMVTTEGDAINHAHIDFTSAITSDTYQLIDNTTLTISSTELGSLTRIIVYDGKIDYDYDTTNTLEVYANINGVNTTTFPRYGTGSSTGSGGGFYVEMSGYTEGETIEILTYAKTSTNTGLNEISIQGTVKELVLNDGEANNGDLLSKTINSATWTTIDTIQINNTDHATGDIIAKATISTQGITGDSTIHYRFYDGTSYSQEFERGTSTLGEGVSLIQGLFSNVGTGTKNIQLQAKIDANSAIINGGNSFAYLTNEILEVVNSYNIYTYNNWTGTSLTGFTAENEQGIIYSDVSGTLEIISTDYMDNLTIRKTDYYNATILNHNATNNLNQSLYQSIVDITSKEISTSNTILNWTLHTEQGDWTTNTGTVRIYPNLDNYTWNWSNNIGYFNQTSLSFTVDNIIEDLTISNLYARDLYFINNKSVSTTITPICTQSGYTYNSYPYYLPLDNAILDCSLFSFQSINHTLDVSTPENATYNMEPAILNLIFTEITEGYVETSSCTDENDCSYFNSTAIYVEQYNISEGYVTVKFNPDATNNWQQIFKYYNDEDTHVKQYIKIETPDLAQVIQVAGAGSTLADTRVCAKSVAQNPDTLTNDWLTTYCDFTNVDGQVTLLIDDQQTYQFCVQAEGYVSKCVQVFIPPANANTILIELSPTETTEGFNYISTDCAGYLTENKTCTLGIATYKYYNTIEIMVLNDAGNTTSSFSDSSGQTASYTLNSADGDSEVRIYLDGVLAKTIKHSYINDPATEMIDYTNREYNGQTFRDRLEGNSIYLYAFYIFMIFIALMMGFVVENHFNDYGVYGSGIWFITLAIGGFPMFMVPALPIALYFIFDTLIPLYK